MGAEAAPRPAAANVGSLAINASFINMAKLAKNASFTKGRR